MCVRTLLEEKKDVVISRKRYHYLNKFPYRHIFSEVMTKNIACNC